MATENFKKIISKRLKIFDGDFISFPQFIDELNELLIDVPAANIAEILRYSLKFHTTPEVYIKIKNVPINSVDNFQKGIDNILYGFQTASSFRKKLENIKQKSGELQNFVDEFRLTLSYMLNKLPDEIKHSEYFLEDIKKVFINNLDYEFRIIAIMHKSKSLEEIVAEIINVSDINLYDDSISEKLDEILVLSAQKN